MSQKEGFVGVFDSGLGGISVLAELIRQMPNLNYSYFGDSLNAPYGTKRVEEVLKRSREICQNFVAEGAVAIVVACNTATAASVKQLRQEFEIPIVGMEPAVKPAATILSKYDLPMKMAVLATPMTLREEKYQTLVDSLGVRESVVELPSPELVHLVENHFEDEQMLKRVVKSYFSTRVETIDHLSVMVLGCTHFVFLRPYFEALSTGIDIVDGNLGTARRLRDLLIQAGELKEGAEHDKWSLFEHGWVKIRNSAGEEKERLSQRMLRQELYREVYKKVQDDIERLLEEARLGEQGTKLARMYYVDRMAAPDIARSMKWSGEKTKRSLETIHKAIFRILAKNA